MYTRSLLNLLALCSFLPFSTVVHSLTVNTASAAGTHTTSDSSVTVLIPSLEADSDILVNYLLDHQLPESSQWIEQSTTPSSYGRQYNSQTNYNQPFFAGEGTYRYRYRKYECDLYSEYCLFIGYGPIHTVNYSTVPPAPGSVSLGSINNDAGNVTVSWPASSGATSYDLQISTNNGSWSTSYSGSSQSKSYTNLASAMREFRVRACSSAGCSAWTESSDIYVARQPGTITTNASSPDTNHNFVLSWGASFGAVDNYQVQRRFADYSSSSWGGWSTISTLNGSTRSLTQSGMADGKWDYRVRSKRGTNYSGWVELSSHVTTLMLPSLPTNLRLLDQSGTTDNTFRIQWDSQATRVTSYDLYRSSAAYGSSSYGPETHLEKGTALYHDENMGVGHHRYRVRACNESGCSALTSYLPTVSVVDTPGVPTGLTATYLGNPHGLQISWNQEASASYYEIARSLDGTIWNENYYSTSNTSFVDEDIDEVGHTIYYKVRACSSVCGQWTSTPSVQ